MRVRRDVASMPVRSARETWRAIVDLVTGNRSVDKAQLEAAASVMESLIADELPAAVPMVFKGVGPRVLVYCLYSEEAMEMGLGIDALGTNPTAGDWRMTAPSEDEDVDWMNKTLESRAPRIRVHPVSEEPGDEDTDEGRSTGAVEIDWDAAVGR
jgi:hypothetical protein